MPLLGALFSARDIRLALGPLFVRENRYRGVTTMGFFSLAHQRSSAAW